MNSIRLLGFKEWRFPSNSKIRFELSIKAYKDQKDIRFCTHLTSVEGQVVSVLQSSMLIDCKEGEEIAIQLEADLSALRPGQYCLAPELYSISEYGTRFSHHKLGMVITFEIEKNDNTSDDLELDINKTGYVKFPDLIDLRK